MPTFEQHKANGFRIFDSGYTLNDIAFPIESFEYLRKNRLLIANVPKKYGGWGLGSPFDNTALLRILFNVGSHDLSLGRIYEGHVNAILLIDTYGTDNQKQKYFNDAINGQLFGIWNSELPSEILKYSSDRDVLTLHGAKVFCSGSKYVKKPIVTAQGKEGTHMIILDLENYQLEEDLTYWQPVGMKSSVSCRFDFSGKTFNKEQILGQVYDYVCEPYFSGGAARFAAVQLGGAAAAIKSTIDHLKKLNRATAAEQNTRLAKLAMLQQTGEVWLNHIGRNLG